MAETTAKSSLRNTLKAWSPAIFDGVIEGTFNAYDYIWGDKKNETDKWQKWLVSSGVDTFGSLLTGGAAALIVAGIIYLVGGAVTIPATLVVVAIIALGALLDAGLEATGVKDTVKEALNTYIDTAQALPATSPAQLAIPIPTPSVEPNSTSTPVAASTTPMPSLPTNTPQVIPNQTPEP